MSKIAVVTGGAQGIGLAVSRKIASCTDCAIAIIDKSDKGEVAASELRSQGADAFFVRGNVASEADVLSIAEIVANYGSVSCLVNCAGVYRPASAIEIAFSDWMRFIEINLGGSFLMSRAFAPAMLREQGGAIVNLSSDIAIHGVANGSHYAASKGGIISLTRSLALEWAPSIRVNAVMPGVIDTEMPRSAGLSQEDLDGRALRIPLGRVGQPEDVANVVAFLLSDEARYLTGQTIGVNGGALMR